MPFFFSSKSIPIAAVSPAVPKHIDSYIDRPSGSGTAHELGTRIYCPKPPAVSIPRSYPVTITLSPYSKLLSRQSTTSPTASIPGVWG